MINEGNASATEMAEVATVICKEQPLRQSLGEKLAAVLPTGREGNGDHE